MKKDEFLYLSDKMDMLDDRLDGVETVLKLQEQNLSAHMRRTELLEQQVSPLNKFMYAAYGIIAFLVFVASITGVVQLLK